MPAPSWGRRWALIAVSAALALSAASASCGNDEGGHLSLRFSGAVDGFLDSEVDVECFLPGVPGGTFSVSVDSEEGVEVGGRQLVALDFSTTEYTGPRAYDVGAALQGDFTADSFFLLFEELEQQPFVWGQEQRSTGVVIVDPGERSGRVSLKGWENGLGMRVDVDGTFRCGEQARKSQ